MIRDEVRSQELTEKPPKTPPSFFSVAAFATVFFTDFFGERAIATTAGPTVREVGCSRPPFDALNALAGLMCKNTTAMTVLRVIDCIAK